MCVSALLQSARRVHVQRRSRLRLTYNYAAAVTYTNRPAASGPTITRGPGRRGYDAAVTGFRVTTRRARSTAWAVLRIRSSRLQFRVKVK